MNTTTNNEQLAIDGAGAAQPEAKEPPRMIARISSLAAGIVFPFIAKDDVRYYLNGINIRPIEGEDIGAIICATDGHRLVICRDPNGFIEHEIIVAVSKDGLKHAKIDNTLDVMSNGAATISDKHAMPLFVQPGNSLIDGNFPRFENVLNLEGYREGIRGAANADYLRTALAIDTGHRTPSIQFWTRDDEDSPLIFIAGEVSGIETIGCIMKLRDAITGLPNWLPKPSPFELTQEATLAGVDKKVAP